MAFSKESERGALWERQGRSGRFLSGKLTVGGKTIEVVAFFNTSKKNPKEPDVRVYESEPRDAQTPKNAPQRDGSATAAVGDINPDDIPF